MCGDSTNAAHVKELVADLGVDLIFTSPPYNVGLPYSDSDDSQSWEGYRALLAGAIEAWAPQLRPGRALCWNIGSAKRSYPGRQLVMIEEVGGLEYYRETVWHKQGVGSPSWYHTERDPRARKFTPNYMHESIYTFTKGALELGEESEIDPIIQHTILPLPANTANLDVPEGDTVSGNRQEGLTRRATSHPAVFPVRLPAAFTSRLTARGEVVADPFAGAGTTALAAAELGRRCLLMELAPAYCDVAVSRWESLTGQRAKRPRRRRS
jgi:DNA modification methylase